MARRALVSWAMAARRRLGPACAIRRLEQTLEVVQALENLQARGIKRREVQGRLDAASTNLAAEGARRLRVVALGLAAATDLAGSDSALPWVRCGAPRQGALPPRRRRAAAAGALSLAGLGGLGPRNGRHEGHDIAGRGQWQAQAGTDRGQSSQEDETRTAGSVAESHQV